MNQLDNEKKRGYRRLSVEELRKCAGCQNYSDEEAEEIIDTLEMFSIIAFKLHQKLKKEQNDNLFNQKNIRDLNQNESGLEL
jgi:hypothetical protein